MRVGTVLQSIKSAACVTLAASLLVSAGASRAFAGEDQQKAHPHQDDPKNVTRLIQAVRDATERFKNVRVAEAEGYALGFGCVSGGEFGAMGLHYINGTILATNVVDVSKPQIVIYEPLSNGQLAMTGADYLVFAGPWNATHSAPPQLMGQAFHLFEEPNRFNLPAFYTLHVWAWKDNPNGMFVNWHPDVDCTPFTPQ